VQDNSQLFMSYHLVGGPNNLNLMAELELASEMGLSSIIVVMSTQEHKVNL
jgi:hypothetical protein